LALSRQGVSFLSKAYLRLNSPPAFGENGPFPQSYMPG